jgi:hypothetical protein
MKNVTWRGAAGIALALLILFASGFVRGCIFERNRSTSDQTGTPVDAGGYEALEKTIGDAEERISEALGEIGEAGTAITDSLAEVGEIRDGADRIRETAEIGIRGADSIEGGICRIMEILREGEKRNPDVEKDSDS